MLQVQVVKGPPTEVQYFDEDDLAHRLTDHDVEVIREIFRTPLTGSYNWDYEAANARIRRLYELGKRFNWNSELDVDWGLQMPAPEGAPPEPEGFADHPKWKALSPEQKADFMRRTTAQTLSQFLHGEQGALMVASQLVSCAPTHDAKLYAASQTFDEARHVEVFHRYLMERCHMIYPINPNLKFLLDKVLTDERWDLKFIGMQILIEGLALAAFQTIHETTPDPLLKQVVGLVMRDEGRHVAFGVNYLEDWIRALPQAEIEERAQFAYEACVVMKNRLISTNVAEEFGFTREEALEINAKTQGGQAFRKFLFERMIPNLKRVGLLTEAIRPKFEELGVLEFENLQHDGLIDWAVLEAPLEMKDRVAA
ncbi:ribonucleoside-diphosphate reductase beta chain [Phenylobacterium zucineum HLK1]|uniref:Ribonucleoside-diphosphate reductase beta chain n=1 Tax=Phenylobacterium zucineum (strain HLK1) TaxID=450851 RepID=B4R8K9_PHEZH|nr:ferritin-like domain-containing protein [Phenylobacterium zucineum]ACG77636.1 ribonucleoside-diphosphate reductase beta chain [Phenylobacterium zucineum HLK1]